MQAALASGWQTAVHYSMGKETGINFSRSPDKFRTGAWLAGYRVAHSTGYASFLAGPSWGKGQRTAEDAKSTRPPDCEGLLCGLYGLEAESYRGWGAHIRMQAAFASRFIGIGVDFHMMVISDEKSVGVGLVLPMGRIK